jgi:hypothetical protein
LDRCRDELVIVLGNEASSSALVSTAPCALLMVVLSLEAFDEDTELKAKKVRTKRTSHLISVQNILP